MKRQIVENLAWQSVEKLLRLFSGIVIGLWIARKLGPETYGSFSYVFAWLGLFNAFAWLGVGDTVTRDLVQRPGETSHLLGSALLIRISGSIVSVCLAIAASVFFDVITPEQFLILLVLSAAVPFAEMPGGIVLWFTAHARLRSVVVARSLALFVGIALRIVVLLGTIDVLLLAATFSIESLLSFVLLIVFYRRAGQSIGTWRYNFAYARRVLIVGLPTVLNAAVLSISLKVDQLVLGQISGMSAVGVYVAALKFSEIWWIFPPMIMQSVAPVYLYAVGSDDVRRLHAARLVGGMAIVSVIPCTLVFAFSGPLVDVLLGQRFYGASEVLRIHIFAAILVFIDAALCQYLIATGRQRTLVLKSIVLLSTNALSALLLVPSFAEKGAAISLLLGYLISVVVLPLVLPALKDIRWVYRAAFRQVPHICLEVFNVLRSKWGR